MRKAELYMHDENPKVDRPSYMKLQQVLDLVRAKRCLFLGGRKYQLTAPERDNSRDPATGSRIGYDAAVSVNQMNPKGYLDAWRPRWSGGIPVWQLQTPRGTRP